uniref:Nudix (nucleoside diphosphate linked moiety X)-type motif 13 n=1 Tax=Neolamprologus brichardi TaxID=32507 RepID=A0A3Q4NBK5_NEOBR
PALFHQTLFKKQSFLKAAGPGDRSVTFPRYVNRLKEDDEACAAALKDGSIFLFHRLSPLLRRPDARTFSPAAFTCSGTEPERLVLQRLGSDGSQLKEAVLIGCSEQNQAQFCLDVGSGLCSGELDQAAVEEASQGTFIDLRKAFFLLPAAEAPLVSKGQALLRWHQTSRFCGASGQPTQRNRAGSQRFCSSSSTVYYPKVTSSVAEEVGLEIQSISYSSSQHWPFPHSSFMLGCHALVSPAHTQVSSQVIIEVV